MKKKHYYFLGLVFYFGLIGLCVNTNVSAMNNNPQVANSSNSTKTSSTVGHLNSYASNEDNQLTTQIFVLNDSDFNQSIQSEVIAKNNSLNNNDSYSDQSQQSKTMARNNSFNNFDEIQELIIPGGNLEKRLDEIFQHWNVKNIQ